MSNYFRMWYRMFLLCILVLWSVMSAFAQESCELFTPSGLLVFHEEHIDTTKGFSYTATDSLHFFFKDQSLSVIEEFLSWGEDNEFVIGMEKDVMRRGEAFHFVKLSKPFGSQKIADFTAMVEKVLEKKKELQMEDCGAMAVGHVATND